AVARGEDDGFHGAATAQDSYHAGDRSNQAGERPRAAGCATVCLHSPGNHWTPGYNPAPRQGGPSMTTTRRQFLSLVSGAAAAAGTRLGASPAFAQTAGSVKIGVLAIRAGIAAPVGAAGLRATEWWADRTNKAGGILGRPVQLVVEEESN